MEVQYVTKIPGKIIINGGYLVLKGHPCVAVTPNAYSLSYVKKSLELEPSIKILTNFSDEALFKFKDVFYVEEKVETTMIYCLSIINLFYAITKREPKEKIEIYVSLDQSLFSVRKEYIYDSIKTGLGSSSVFLISIVDALLPNKISEDKFFKLCCDINLSINKISSCCDIAACIFGSIVYKKYKFERIKFTDNYVMILGSFNKSTSTREMIKNINDDEHWDELSKLNDDIVKQLDESKAITIKDTYMMYLDKLRSISNVIVPEKQYNILKNTFKLDVFGCGVSGSGGEDAVWCIVDRECLETVVELWNSCFEYVNVFENINCEPFIYNIEVFNK